METLRLNHVSKIYKAKKRKEKDVLAVDDFNLSAEDNEFIVFVGPSGCGKSTTLRMIAGLEDISSGDIYINGSKVNDVEANYRDIAMVFQNYALYPHFTAYQNMAFGLKNRHVPKDEIDLRIKAAAKILDIEELLNRKPGAMSGGQRQRVALGRAIVRRPKIFLLDEPLSNLDAKLRASMRVEIYRLYEELKTTFIYVTHDQVEAMTMGTRIVVMKGGVVQQIDTPTNLFDYPRNRFVAGFLGTPQMNFYEGIGKKNKTKFEFKMHGITLSYPTNDLKEINQCVLDGVEHKMILGIRPDDIRIEEKGVLEAKLNHMEVLGNETLLYADFGEGTSRDSETSMVIKINERRPLNKGDVLHLNFLPEKVHFFENDESSEKSLMITPRSNLNELIGYLDLSEDNEKVVFDNGVTLSLEKLDKSKVNSIYLSGIHRVKLQLNEESVSINPEGEVVAVYQGSGIYGGKLLLRFDLNINSTYDESFDSPTTHLYVDGACEFNIGDKVNLSIDENKIDFIGDDHLSIFDQNEKETKIEEYKITTL